MIIKQIFLTALLTVSPLISFAEQYYTTTTELNVRTGPGIDHPVSFTLQKGAEVEFVASINQWYKIKYIGKTGYVNSKYLNHSRNITVKRSSEAPQTVPYLIIGAFIILAFYGFFIIYRKIYDIIQLRSVTDRKRGTQSERDLILQLLKFGIPKHKIFHDLFLENRQGRSSQIDLVVITKVGIIVFEVKDYSGWIYGSGNQTKWTKVLAYGKQKYRFYNPIMQNNKHIDVLRKKLYQFKELPYFSMVVFYGDCELKDIDYVPNGLFVVKSKRVKEVLRKILRENGPVPYSDENEVIRFLRQAAENGGILENQIQHSENIKDMLGTLRVFD